MLQQKDQEEAAAVFADFVADFAEPPSKPKTFIRGETVNGEGLVFVHPYSTSTG